LFVLDDGPTMGVKLDTFRAALPELVASLDNYAELGSPVSYHLGVVTSDLGAAAATLPQYGCHPGGDGARLRDAGGTGGVRYIDDNQLSGDANVPDVAAALTALADVGTAGCAFRHPLEAAYRALHDQIPENAAFLRADALLVVVFVSDGDDCSAPPNSDLFDANATPFACTRFGIACNGMPVPTTTVSGLTGCTSQTMADGGKLLDLDRYTSFFYKPAAQGGVKVDPNDVMVLALTAPSDPVGVTIDAMQPVLNPSCMAQTDVRFFGAPAVRLNSVAAAGRNHNLTSICDTDDSAAMRSLESLLFSHVRSVCLDSAVAARADGTPDCIVEDVTANPDGSTSVSELPSCAENGDVVPCWALVDRLAQYETQGCASASPACKLPPTCQPIIDPIDGRRELYAITVERLTPPPAHTITNISCATIPPP
ncbi:MAG: hypothetical protein ACXVDD_06900, partial [Polyangia bacterium]